MWERRFLDGTDRVETFRWSCSDKDVTQEEVDTLAWISCGLNGDGVLVIEGSAE